MLAILSCKLRKSCSILLQQKTSYHFNFCNSCLPKILLGSFLKTFSQKQKQLPEVFLKISQNLKENTCAGVFLIKLEAENFRLKNQFNYILLLTLPQYSKRLEHVQATASENNLVSLKKSKTNKKFRSGCSLPLLILKFLEQDQIKVYPVALISKIEDSTEAATEGAL